MIDTIGIRNLLEQVSEMIAKQQSSEFPLHLIRSLCLERLYFNQRYRLIEEDSPYDDGPGVA